MSCKENYMYAYVVLMKEEFGEGTIWEGKMIFIRLFGRNFWPNANYCFWSTINLNMTPKSNPVKKSQLPKKKK